MRYAGMRWMGARTARWFLRFNTRNAAVSIDYYFRVFSLVTFHFFSSLSLKLKRKSLLHVGSTRILCNSLFLGRVRVGQNQWRIHSCSTDNFAPGSLFTFAHIIGAALIRGRREGICTSEPRNHFTYLHGPSARKRYWDPPKITPYHDNPTDTMMSMLAGKRRLMID